MHESIRKIVEDVILINKLSSLVYDSFILLIWGEKEMETVGFEPESPTSAE